MYSNLTASVCESDCVCVSIVYTYIQVTVCSDQINNSNIVLYCFTLSSANVNRLLAVLQVLGQADLSERLRV